MEMLMSFFQFGIRLIYILIGMLVVFQLKLKRIWIFPISCCVFIGSCLFLSMEEIDISVLMNIIILVTSYYTIYMPVHTKRWWIICILFLLIYFEEFTYMFTEKIVSYLFEDISRVTIGVINGLICIIILLFGSRIVSNRKKIIDRRKILIVLRKCMIPLVVFLAVEMVVVIITLDELAAVSSNPNDKKISAILGILSMISIGILFVIVIYIKNTNDRMEHFLIVKEQLQRLQINYYETLLEKEKATKKYRHDMNNHLICLNRLVKDGDLPRTQEYIAKMSNQMEGIEKKSVATGNNILDVLLNYYIAQLDESVSVQVIGKCIDEIKVSDVDLCIIFSNIIQNAVEAIAKNQEAEPIFKVEIVSGRHFVKIVIKNSLNIENIQFNKRGGLKTTKDDQYNHGIGIQNSKETVYRNKGEIDFTIEEKYFVCKVLLPIESE